MEQEYDELIKRQTEILKDEFKKIDKDGNSKIDESELMAFLESKGKNIERESFLKLIRTLDLNADGLITIDEFINSYIRIMGELRITITENEEKIKALKQEQDILEKNLQNAKGEKFNDEGISSDAHVEVNLDVVEIHDTRLQSFDKVEAIIALGNFKQKFTPLRVENKEFVFNKNIKM